MRISLKYRRHSIQIFAVAPHLAGGRNRRAQFASVDGGTASAQQLLTSVIACLEVQ